MEVQFWGVRGSIAVSGERYVGTGGNTSCVEVRHEGARIVCDGGTGLRALGESLGFGPQTLTVFFSHYHWDHIQGVPFFGPVFNPNSEITFAGVRRPMAGVREALDAQMQAPTFPIGLDMLQGAKHFVDLEPNSAGELGPFRVRTSEQPHPNGSCAVRIEAGGAAVVYATDTEHGVLDGIDPRLLELAEGADLLIHDSQYFPDEYTGADGGPPRKHWGHSTWEEAVEAAERAGVRRLALFHHDPARDDAGVAKMEALAQARFPGAFAAREGQVVELG